MKTIGIIVKHIANAAIAGIGVWALFCFLAAADATETMTFFEQAFEECFWLLIASLCLLAGVLINPGFAKRVGKIIDELQALINLK